DRNLQTAAQPDPFSEWWRWQNDEAPATPSRHLPRGIAGAAALDANGEWRNDAVYGEVWLPAGVAVDWMPYRDGVWRFLPPFGWSWVDNTAWGFATSHYGRWARIDDRWAWVPPTADKPAEYSPAAVAFLGTAPIGLSCPGDQGPAVAWFPLAPGETVGDGNEETYKNRRFATAVLRGVFAGGKPVAPALVDLPEQRLLDAPVILGALGIPPAAAAIAVAARKPVAVFAKTLAATVKPPPIAAVKPMLAALASAVQQARTLPPAPRHEVAVALPVRKRLTLAAAATGTVRARPAPSTGAAHPAHTPRQHLAARGGAL
ncbi:MAG: hypothetical protein JO032_01485, partial [Alphaproteobacteria bacterium]|nr:hypothetical protein [Alphaproteobacteria bacterium]